MTVMAAGAAVVGFCVLDDAGCDEVAVGDSFVLHPGTIASATIADTTNLDLSIAEAYQRCAAA
jgi:hypothetical protein